MEKINLNIIPIIKFDNYSKNEIISFLNKVSYIINSFFISINQKLISLQNIFSTLNKQIISSYYLIKEIKLEEFYSTKLHQLYDRIGMMEDSRKLFKEDIKLINYQLNNFSNDIKKLLLKFEENNKNNNINYQERINYFDYSPALNICNNCKSNSKSHKNNLNINSNIKNIKGVFNTINFSNNLYNQMNKRNKNNSVRNIFQNSDSTQEISSNIKNNKYLNHRNNLKIKTENEIDFTQINNKINITKKRKSNSSRYQLKSDSAKYINQDKEFNNRDIFYNKRKPSRSFSKNRLMKKTRSLSNFVFDQNTNFSKDKNSNNINNIILNTNLKKYHSKSKTKSNSNRNIINNTIINNNNELNSNTINNINYKSIISHQNEFNKNKEYLFFLSNKVIQFLSIIKEMKTKYNNRNCENKEDFKETKQKYEKLKKLIWDLSNKIISKYYNNLERKNENNLINYDVVNNYNNIIHNNNYIQELLNQNKINEEKIIKLENLLKCIKIDLYIKEKENKNLILIKEKLLNIIYQKNNISKTSKGLEIGNKINNYNNNINTINPDLINNLKHNLELYKRKINELKFDLESKILEIKNKDKIIENLKNRFNNHLINNKINNINRNSQKKERNLFTEDVINFSLVNKNKEINYLDKSTIEEKDEIIAELKKEIQSLKNEPNENINNNIINEEKINHINNNNYIIKELKEKIKQLTEENSNYKNKNNSLEENNKLLNQKIDELSKDLNKNELLREDQENEIKKLQSIIDDLNVKINENSNNNKISNESKGKEEQIEFLLTENNELKNQIKELKEKENNSNSNINENENNYKKIIEDYENKIKLLSDKNNYYINEINNLKTENNIVQNEFKTVKEENNILNKKIKEYDIKNDEEENLKDNYGIICMKSIGNLSWILLRKKDGDENDYDDYIWIEKDIIENIDKFNYIY